MRCPGSLLAGVLANLEDKDSEYALEGSRAHRFAEMLLTAQQDEPLYQASDWRGVAIVWTHRGVRDSFTPDEEMITSVQEYADWCNELPGRHFIEVRVDLSEFLPLEDQFGTADHGAVYGDTLVVSDFKYGAGVRVFAEENEQAMGYALGLYNELSWAYPIKKIVIRIGQPRLQHWDVWETTVERLKAFAQEMRAKCEIALAPDPPVIPGEKQCFFCAVSGRCAAQKRAAVKIASNDFDSFDEQPVGILNGDDLNASMHLTGFVSDWLRATHKAAMALSVSTPEQLPDWKIVETVSHRKWVAPGKAKHWLLEHGLKEEQIETKELVSPAQAEKLCRKEVRKQLKEAELWVQPPGKPALVSVTDKRQRYVNVALSDFDDFEIDESTELNESGL